MKITVYNGKLDGVLDAKGDFFIGSFITGANVMGNRVRVIGFDPNEKKIDLSVKDLFLAFRAKGTTIDLKDAVILFPILALTATFACSKTEIFLDKEIQTEYKELIENTINAINTLGGKAEKTEKGATVIGMATLKGGAEVNAFSNPWLALALILSGTVSEEKITISGVESLFAIKQDLLQTLKDLGLNYEIE